MFHFHVLPATISENQATVVWEKPTAIFNVAAYQIQLDNDCIAVLPANKTHFTVQHLHANTTYRLTLYCLSDEGERFDHDEATCSLTTMSPTEWIDVTRAPYLIDPTGATIATHLLQQAIDECSLGGTVLIPKEANILSGAIQLKSHMTLQIDGCLTASQNPDDFRFFDQKMYDGICNEDGLPLSRYEGWELYCYRSLINIGYIDPSDRQRIVCNNVRICGTGTINGGGNQLGMAMREIYANKEKFPQYVSDQQAGRRARGRLISTMQAKNIHMTGLKLINPPSWTIHMIYSDTIVSHGLTILSKGIDNGDGWDPDSSRNLWLFDTEFDTGDDCVAIKSGKNPEGNIIHLPTKGVHIFDLNIRGGHGIAIGSEQSGGVEDVYISDCVIKNTFYGIELKAQNERGGYIKNIHIRDCSIDRFMAHPVTYNADGQPAHDLPVISDIFLTNVTITGDGRVIELIGFSNKTNHDVNPVENVHLDMINVIATKETADMLLTYCRKIHLRKINVLKEETLITSIEKQDIESVASEPMSIYL
ncbi:glycosyl hydrolase family 28 protein [Enterococcus sp. RIT-PI-f]|uniref:glycosyl hydrolase family 28 protein n=1 Tax=Enterococcus sp. RIT-PI-f TaxID=1690244 RepID=UPI001364CC4A|nr:glycosyl hydrolase family 28 protein [Enterococcus sp. RIT-PI-f]